MRRFLLSVSLVAILSLAGTVRAQAEGYYLGGGFQTQSFGADWKRGLYYDMRPTAGAVINGGYQFTPRLSIDLFLGQSSPHDVITDRDYTYRWVEVGPKYLFFPDAKIHPFAIAGLGSYSLDRGGGSKFDGFGAFAGVGLEEYTTDRISAQVYLRGNYWVGDPYKQDVAALNFGLIFHYHFGPVPSREQSLEFSSSSKDPLIPPSEIQVPSAALP